MSANGTSRKWHPSRLAAAYGFKADSDKPSIDTIIRVDQPTVKTGAVTFDVTNWSASVLHEMLVISVDNPNAPLFYDYYQARVPEDQVKVLGEVADLEPNASKTLELTLAPGSYLLICNVPGHYASGMVAALNVTP
jgi:uncharacterized cupredoxin-like copper-binding protein